MGLRSNASFVKLFLGRFVTNAGDSMYLIASLWLVHELTGSTFYTGIAGFLMRGPSALQFLAGPIVDRYSLRGILVSTQLVQAVAVLSVPIAAATGNLTVWILLTIMPVLTFLNQFVYPAQSAALPQIVEDDELVSANSLFSMALQGSDMFFNAASGILISIVGAVALFTVDAVTFGVAALLFASVVVDGDREEDDDDDTSFVTELREGVQYIRGSVVPVMLLGSLTVNFIFGAGIAVFPAFAAERGGPATYGLLMGTFGAGNMVGALIASKVDTLPYGKLQIVGNLVAMVLIASAILITWLPATLALLFVGFIPIGLTTVMTTSLMQSSLKENFLGRVTSLRRSASTAMIPGGSLIGGFVGEFVGVVPVLLAVAACIGLLGVYYLVHPMLRSLPPVAEADETALGL